MAGGDKRQTQDERALEQDGAEDVREEFTTYREVKPGRGLPGEAAARREAELQPAPTREGVDGDGAEETGDAGEESGDSAEGGV
jgi:hypothetical protein